MLLYPTSSWNFWEEAWGWLILCMQHSGSAEEGAGSSVVLYLSLEISLEKYFENAF